MLLRKGQTIHALLDWGGHEYRDHNVEFFGVFLERINSLKKTTTSMMTPSINLYLVGKSVIKATLKSLLPMNTNESIIRYDWDDSGG